MLEVFIPARNSVGQNESQGFNSEYCKQMSCTPVTYLETISIGAYHCSFVSIGAHHCSLDDCSLAGKFFLVWGVLYALNPLYSVVYPVTYPDTISIGALQCSFVSIGAHHCSNSKPVCSVCNPVSTKTSLWLCVAFAIRH